MKTTPFIESAPIKVVPIKAGVGHCYLVIHGAGFFLVDTGSPGLTHRIVKSITSRGLSLSDLQFIFLTHTHYDHAGNACALQKASGAPLVVHESEADFLQNGWHDIPSGTNPLFRLISAGGRRLGSSHAQFEPAQADVVFGSGLDLTSMGAPARIVHSPGHTLGSSSLVIGRVLFGGDSIFNVGGMIWPPFANDEAGLLRTWRLFGQMDLEYLYPAHGKRIGKEVFDRALSKRLES